jgi:two-component sensor histidine kinase
MVARTIRTNLLWILFAAIVPIAGIAVWQAWLALHDSRDLISWRLRANAWAVAESERDPFIIARHSLSIVAMQPDVRNVGPQCGKILTDALRGARGVLNFIRTDADGKARCSVLPFSQGQDLSNDGWWRARRDRASLYLAGPEIGTISQRPVLVMVQPLVSADGTFMGTVSAGIGIEHIQAALQRKKIEGRGMIVVTNARGKPIIVTEKVGITQFSDVRHAQSRPHVAEAPDGKRWTYVSAPLFSNELYVLYAEPARSTTRAALSRIWPSLLLPLLALALASLAIWIATQRLILRWLYKLQSLTGRFARGDFRDELQAYERAPVELQQFATDLHDMAGAIEEKERDLREALANTVALTKEVNHRVKNNLQIVNSLLTLQAERITEPVAHLALVQAKSRISALGLIHRLLYDEDSGAEPGKVNMNRLLGGLCEQLRSTYRDRTEIDLDCNAAEIDLEADKAVPVTLFTVEAITNAFQHAFVANRSGRIEVDFSTGEQRAEMRVADDGQGFVQEAVIGQMGIDLITAFADQAGGEVEISSTPSGTIVALRFPL